MADPGPLLEILRLNTDLLHNALDGMSDEDASRRIHGTNPAAFLAVHVVDARYFMADLLGAPLPNPFSATLGDARSADDVAILPSLAEIRSAWGHVGAHLAGVLAAATPEQLAAPSSQPFPLLDPSLGSGIAFLMQHESYHVGQVALVRRQLGYPAMTYRRRPL